VELLDRRIGASGFGACQRSGVEYLARCRRRRVRALAASKIFSRFGKTPNRDIPIMKEAKAEYAKLQ